ncbi:MAG: cobalamin-binding protein [Ideonella sp. MAG2]|nr:MAG: cobalamin-binding protein [Ideonella sp. MAG2]
MRRVCRWVCALGMLALGHGAMAQAAASTTDDDGRVVTLARPAQRIISFAPHATELIFAAGGGAQLVGTMRYSDYPEAAKAVPIVGDAHGLDLERIASLQPDLLVIWPQGNSAAQLERLRALKLPMFHSEPHSLAQIGDSLRRLGVLMGTSNIASKAAQAYETELQALRARYSQRPPVSVFYQIWHQPLLTVNDQHVIGDVLRLCGGRNVFGKQPVLVPQVSVEAVLAAQPQALATSTGEGKLDEALAPWRSFKHFAPLAKQAVIAVHGDYISRHTPRILVGARRICEGLEQVRQGLPVAAP